MKRIAVLAAWSAVCCLSVAAFAQADLDAFPTGATKMVYSLQSEDMSRPMPLELTVVAHGDGTYSVRMIMESTGTKDELGSFGFIGGATSVSASGQDVNYTSLQALMDQRSRLQEGQEYLLPGGGAFKSITGVTIAGVWCLQGEMVDPSNPDTRMTVAFALSNPVYISPRILVEELRGGQWVRVFSLEMTEYTVTGN